jgi:hypothetical protein
MRRCKCFIFSQFHIDFSFFGAFTKEFHEKDENFTPIKSQWIMQCVSIYYDLRGELIIKKFVWLNKYAAMKR